MITFSFGTIKQAHSLNEKERTLFRNYLLSKTNRLIIPYLFWVFIYWCWGCARMLSSHGEIINVPVTILLPLYGTSIHLWYIPFIFIGLIAVSFTKLYFPLKSLFSISLYLFLSLLTGLLPVFVQNTNQLPLPIPQFLFALPALFLGLTISDTMDVNKPLKYCLILLIISLIGAIRLLLNSNDSFLFLYLLSFLLVVTMQNIPGKIDSFTKQLSPLTFGIYLIHPIIAAIIVNIATITNFQRIAPINSIIIFISSAICIYILKKTTLEKYV
jgi:fucose 4-O-acetylase-like acetyltransferase